MSSSMERLQAKQFNERLKLLASSLSSGSMAFIVGGTLLPAVINGTPVRPTWLITGLIVQVITFTLPTLYQSEE